MGKPRTPEIDADSCLECHGVPEGLAFVLGNGVVCHSCAAPAFAEECPACFNSRYTFMINPSREVNCALCDGFGYVLSSQKDVKFRLVEVQIAEA